MDGLLGRLEGHQRQPAVAIDARHQREISPGLPKDQRRSLDRTGLGEGLGDVIFGRDGPCDLHELTRILQGRQEGAQILIGHGRSFLAVHEYKA